MDMAVLEFSIGQSYRCSLHLYCRGPLNGRGSDYPEEPQQADSSDYDSHVGISVDIVPPHATAEPDIDVTSSDGNSTVGHHSNRYNLPMSVLICP